MNKIAQSRDQWCGMPMPIEGEQLVLEASHPEFDNYRQLNLITGKDEDLGDDNEGWRIVNSWYSRKWRCDIYILQGPDGKYQVGKMPAFHHIKYDLSTMACSVAWSIESESKALETLAGMLPHHAFKYYLMTGIFLESSKRSGITYIFRKLKPTVAIKASHGDDEMKILAALCMHPLAYYAGSWAGAMTPTDDVIAHLQMMRADEHFYWKRCNQHRPYRPEAGL
jgi:hypothetical protein